MKATVRYLPNASAEAVMPANQWVVEITVSNAVGESVLNPAKPGHVAERGMKPVT